MRQLLIRVPDDVHARLAARAARSRRSMNEIALEMPERDLADERFDERARVRGRVRARGFLAESDPPLATVTAEDVSRPLSMAARWKRRPGCCWLPRCSGRRPPRGFGSYIRDQFAEIGGGELDIPSRTEPARAVDLGA